MLDLLLQVNVKLTPGLELGAVLLKYVFPFLTLAGLLWAIYIGIDYARASDDGKRKAARSRLVKAVATVLIIIACYFILLGVNNYNANTGRKTERKDDNPYSFTYILDMLLSFVI